MRYRLDLLQNRSAQDYIISVGKIDENCMERDNLKIL